MKRANKTGSIYKYSGNRRKPFGAYITKEVVLDEENKTVKCKRVCIGSYATKKEAQCALDEYTKNPFDLDATDITFGEVWEKAYSRMHLSDSRMQQLRLSYKNYFFNLKDMEIRKIKAEHLQKIIDDCPHKSSAKSVLKSIMNKTFEYAMANDMVQKDYSKYVKYEHDAVEIERTLFDGNQAKILLDNYKDYRFAYLLILLYTGLRPSELTELKKENVHLNERYFDIVQSKTAAGVRSVPISDVMLPVFEYYMSIGGYNLLQSSRGTKVEYRNFMARHLQTVAETIGARHTPYDCRHTFITRARECGVEHLCLQKIVGHKPETITEEVYTHLTIEELLREINKVNY